jgi:hypothetical protein
MKRVGISDNPVEENDRKVAEQLIHEGKLNSTKLRATRSKVISSDDVLMVTDRTGRSYVIDRSGFEARQEAIASVAKADPKNIQEVAASQLSIINSYYHSGLQQSQQSFRWSLIWGGIGFGFLIVAVSVLLFRQPTEVAFASGIAGTLVEVFAGTYLYLYKHASDQLAAFRTSLESTQHLLLANSLCEKL